MMNLMLKIKTAIHDLSWIERRGPLGNSGGQLRGQAPDRGAVEIE
jgi:hypothetical protein